MSKAPVTQVGKYQVIDLVGEGAMGAVYRALDPVLNRTVAIKVMSDAIARDDTLRDRFMREAQAAGSLQHPNVVTIYDFGEFEGHLFIAMEFVEGNDLEQLIEKRVPMTLDQRLGMVIDVLLGLTYAHRRGVVHRDIKPGNIRVTEDGRAKIMDFGVAHLESTKMTATGVMVGTPNYMAPEQVTGQKVGPPTDIFAIGAVLYELLSHRRAFTADSLHSVLFKVVSEDPPSLRLIAPDVPPILDPIVQKALSKEPADRYQSAQEMANELTAARAKLTGERSASLSLAATIASHTGEHVARAARAARRRRRRIATAVGGLVVVIGGVGSAMWLTRSADGSATVSKSGLGSLPAPPNSMVAATDSDTIAPAAPKADSSPNDSREALPSREEQRRAERGPTSLSVREGAAPPRPTSSVEARVADSMFNVARAARSSAVRAGAPDSLLAPGDSLLSAGLRLQRDSRYVDAALRMNDAVNLWRGVQRQAERAVASNTSSGRGTPGDSDSRNSGTRDSGTRDSVTRAAPEIPPPAPVTTRPPAASSSSVATPPPEKRLEPPPPPASQAIPALVAEYARAIGREDLAEIRRLFPAITTEQQRAFQQFFAVVRDLKATLTMSELVSEGAVAASRITGTYEYVDANGRAVRQDVAFRATYRREGMQWRIVSVRDR